MTEIIIVTIIVIGIITGISIITQAVVTDAEHARERGRHN